MPSTRESAMPNNRPKCIIILSTKSAGSSACQNLLAKFSKISHLTKTRHFQNETLYWTKAASILNMQQISMLDSEVPLPRQKAQHDLLKLLEDNLDSFTPPKQGKELIFEGWRALCRQYSPIFLEKSPHHLYQWSAIQLILEAMDRLDDIDFILIGLVRNPMDMLYSSFRRWRIDPEKAQYEWMISYRNLLKLKKLTPEKLIIIRYEDMVANLDCLQPVFEFCGASTGSADKKYLHKKSLQRWKGDRLYGFNLAGEVLSLAQSFGYRQEELLNNASRLWPYYRGWCRTIFKLVNPFHRAVLWLKKTIRPMILR